MFNEFHNAKAVFCHGLTGSIWLSLLVVTFHWNMFLVNIILYLYSSITERSGLGTGGLHISPFLNCLTPKISLVILQTNYF